MAILENWNEVSNAQEVAADSLGTTEQKYADYMDSIEAHMNQLSTTWSQFLLNMDVSGKANAVINAINGIVKVLDFLINKTPVATIAVTALVAALTRLAAVNLGKFANSMINFANSIMNLSNGKGALSGIFSFFTTGAFAKGMGTATKEMGNLAKGGTAVAKAMSQGGTQFASFGKAATAAMTSTTASTVGTTTAVTSLGAALATVGKMLGVIGLIGGAIWAVSTILDALITTDEELDENIQTTRDNISESQATIEDYNTTLQENKDRIEEINELKGTSQWSADLEKEAESLEKQNALLERKIALEERRMELEQAELSEQINEQFDRDYKDISYKDGLNESWGISAYRDKITEHNKEVDKAIQLENEYTAALNDESKSQEDRDKLYEDWQEALSDANSSEKELTDILETMSKDYDLLNDENKETVDSMRDMASSIKLADSEFATYGEMLNYTSGATNGVTEAVQTMADELRSINGIDIVPEGVDTMEEFVSQMSETDFDNFKWILQNAGNLSGVLSEVFSGMTVEEAIQTANDALDRFSGKLQTCTEDYNEFKTTLETPTNTEATQYLEMFEYVRQSMNNGVQNATAYQQALEGIGITGADSAAEVEAQFNKLNQSVQKYYDSANGKLRTDVFWEDAKELIRQDSSLGTIENINGVDHVTISSYQDLAEAMQLDQKFFSGLIEDAQRFAVIEESFNTNAMQQHLKDAAQAAKEASDSFENAVTSMGKMSTDTTGQASFVLNADYNPEEVYSAIQKAQEQYESVARQSGFKVEIPVDIQSKIDNEGIESLNTQELQTVISQYQSYFNQVQSLVDEAGNIDTSAITNIAQELVNNGDIASEDITIDGDNIAFNTEGVQQKFVEALEHTYEGVDVSSILRNAIDSGMQFSMGDVVGSEVFSGVASQLYENLQAAIDANTSALNISVADMVVTGNDETASQVDGIINTLTSMNSVDLSGLAGSMSTAGEAAEIGASQINEFVTAENKLYNKTVVVTMKVNDQTGGKLQTYTSVTESANGRQIPMYANGKMGEPLRTERGANSFVGEEAEELVVSKDGKQRLVGQHGAELVHLKPGDTVIPANVTKMIQNGEIGAYANGAGSSGGSFGQITSASGSTVNVKNWYGDVHGSSSSGSSSSGSSSSSSSSNSSSSSSGSSSSSSESSEDPAEDLIAELEHRRNMEYITEEQYLNELTKIWEAYYKGKEEFRDKDWQYEEEIHNLRKQMIEDEIDTLEYQNGILERTYGTEQKQIANLQRMQELYHQQAEEYRANGFDDLSPEIRELSESWWNAYDEINDLQHQIFDNVINDQEHELSILDSQIDRLEEFQDDFSMTTEDLNKMLDEQLSEYVGLQEQKAIRYQVQLSAIETEISRLMQAGYEKNKELIQDLEEQAEDVKNNIIDIGQSIKDMELSKIEVQLERQEQIRQGIIEYAEEQIKKLEEEIDLLEKENDEKEKAQELERLQQALENAKQNRMKRVYHADTGY